MILIDPSFTKIALCKCKRSGKLTVWKTKESNELKRLKKGFETLTNLCSCYHIDSNPNVSKNFSKDNCYIYFAVNIPLKEYTTLTFGQHFENYKFFNISEIDKNPKKFAWYVNSNITLIKNFCKNKSKFELVKPLCKNCVSFNREKHFEQIKVVIFDSTYKNFLLFKKDDVFDVFYENCDKNLTNNDQVAKMLSNLLNNDLFVLDFDSPVVKKNVFSVYYCTANNIDKIKNGKVVEINSISENGYFSENNEVSTFVMVNLERIKRYTVFKSISS